MSTKNVDPTLQPLPTMAELKKLALADFDQWLRLIVTGGARLPFGSSATYDSHPLRKFFDGERVINKPIFLHCELMMLWAERLGYCDAVPSDPTFITVRERVQQVLLLDLSPLFADFCGRADSIEAYLGRFIQEAGQLVGIALNDVAWNVAMGAPLYKLGKGSEEVVRLSDADLPSAYLNGRAIYEELDGIPARRLPRWVEGHGFRLSEIEALPLFFTSDPRELGAPQLAALRAAFRNHIGLENRGPATHAAASEPGPGSKLMRHLREVRDRYYGSDRFSLADRDTWPKQVAVVEWLKSDRGLTEREAMAVDVVARPDEVRGK